MPEEKHWHGLDEADSVRRMRHFAGLPLALLLAACSSNPTPAARDVQSVQALRDGLAKAGVPCDNYQPHPDVIGAREDGSCATTGGDMTLTIYNSAADREALRRAGEGIVDVVYVEGDAANGGAWSVAVPSRETADEVAAALGGKVAPSP